MFLMSALVVIFSKTNSTQLEIAVVTSLAALVLHAAYVYRHIARHSMCSNRFTFHVHGRYKPFVNPRAYWLQFMMLSSIVLVFYVGLVFKVCPSMVAPRRPVRVFTLTHCRRCSSCHVSYAFCMLHG